VGYEVRSKCSLVCRFLTRGIFVANYACRALFMPLIYQETAYWRISIYLTSPLCVSRIHYVHVGLPGSAGAGLGVLRILPHGEVLAWELKMEDFKGGMGTGMGRKMIMGKLKKLIIRSIGSRDCCQNKNF
jgi:hypothetical protein